MSMTEDRLDVWDCRFCIASGKSIIWNARKDGNPRHDADREQLIQSWLTHQARCKNREALSCGFFLVRGLHERGFMRGTH